MSFCVGTENERANLRLHLVTRRYAGQVGEVSTSPCWDILGRTQKAARTEATLIRVDQICAPQPQGMTREDRQTQTQIQTQAPADTRKREQA